MSDVKKTRKDLNFEDKIESICLIVASFVVVLSFAAAIVEIIFDIKRSI